MSWFMRGTKKSLLLAAIAISVSASANAAPFVIAEGTGPFVPSFRGSGSNTTYFGWESGTWDGNPDPGPDTVNGVPSINPGSLAGTLLVQNSGDDIVSSSNNLYPGGFDLTLTIPTGGPGDSTGMTTIIVQGNGLQLGIQMGVFGFGPIAGVNPTYAVGLNAEAEAQWWAKWEIPGGESSYSVDISDFDPLDIGVSSVTDMIVDTYWSLSGFAGDTAVVPEPGAMATFAIGAVGLISRGIRRRRLAHRD